MPEAVLTLKNELVDFSRSTVNSASFSIIHKGSESLEGSVRTYSFSHPDTNPIVCVESVELTSSTVLSFSVS